MYTLQILGVMNQQPGVTVFGLLVYILLVSVHHGVLLKSTNTHTHKGVCTLCTLCTWLFPFLPRVRAHMFVVCVHAKGSGWQPETRLNDGIFPHKSLQILLAFFASMSFTNSQAWAIPPPPMPGKDFPHGNATRRSCSCKNEAG